MPVTAHYKCRLTRTIQYKPRLTTRDREVKDLDGLEGVCTCLLNEINSGIKSYMYKYNDH